MARTLALFAAALTLLALFASPAVAFPRQPATREYVSSRIVYRHLLSDVVGKDRRHALRRSECFGDGYRFTSTRHARAACYLKRRGIMGDTGASDVYPTFLPQAPVTRQQMRLIANRLTHGGHIEFESGRFLSRRKVRQILRQVDMHLALEGQPR